MLSIEEILIVAATLLLLGVVASKASSKLGVPALLLFLLIGMLAGSEGPGRIPFDNPRLAQSVGVVALSFILFAGGLDTDWSKVSSVLWRGLSLASLGVVITAVLVGWFATLLFRISWTEGLLLGSIVSSTDAAAVFSVLRSQNVSLKGRIQPLLELESGSNDPMALFLTIGLIHLLASPGEGPLFLLSLFLKQMLIGAVIGWGIGRVAAPLINWLKLDAEGLYAALTVAIVMLTYGAASSLGGSGFLAVYIAGLVMGNERFRSPPKPHEVPRWSVVAHANRCLSRVGAAGLSIALAAFNGRGGPDGPVPGRRGAPCKRIYQPGICQTGLSPQAIHFVGGAARSGSHCSRDISSACRRAKF